LDDFDIVSLLARLEPTSFSPEQNDAVSFSDHVLDLRTLIFNRPEMVFNRKAKFFDTLRLADSWEAWWREDFKLHLR